MDKRKREEDRQTARAEKVIDVYRSLKHTVKTEKNELKKAIQELKDSEQAQSILQQTAKKIQDQVHKQLSLIVTKSLKAVFPDPYSFEIQFRQARGKTEARLVFVKNGQEHSARDGIGGSVLQVAAFALRLGCLMIQKPTKRKVVCLDEPFKDIKGENKERARDLLISLSKELGVQFIIVTNENVLEVGRIVRI